MRATQDAFGADTRALITGGRQADGAISARALLATREGDKI